MFKIEFKSELVKDKKALSILEQMDFEKWVNYALSKMSEEWFIKTDLPCDIDDYYYVLTSDNQQNFLYFLMRELCGYTIMYWYDSNPKEIEFDTEEEKEEFYEPIVNKYPKWVEMGEASYIGEIIMNYLQAYLDYLKETNQFDFEKVLKWTGGKPYKMTVARDIYSILDIIEKSYGVLEKGFNSSSADEVLALVDTIKNRHSFLTASVKELYPI